jgi:flagellar secretion chaperone FliS
MTYSAPANAYRHNAILGSSQEQLVPLLYEHLMVNLSRGVLLMRKGDIEGKATALGKASDILFELLESLDFDSGGEVASRLAALYGFFLQEISAAGRTMDAERVERLQVMVERLHSAWQGAVADPGVRTRQTESFR